MAEKIDSIIRLMPWQRRFFEDKSRIKVGCVHRQGGKDFVSAAEAVDDSISKGTDWYIVSLTQRQADATFAKCKKIAEAYKRVLKLKAQIRYSDREYLERDREIDQHFRCTARTLHLPGGGTVTSLPGRDPDTLAGLTGSVLFTEFGLFPKGGFDHWRVIWPLTTRGYRVIVISTPRAKNTKFFELVNNPDINSVHFQTIIDSVREGFVLRGDAGEPITIEQFKSLYSDEIGWRREYLCEFTGDLEALIKWSQLVAAGTAGADLPFDYLRVNGDAGWKSGFFGALRETDGRAEIGWDVARKPTGDISSLWVNVARPGRPKHLRYLVVMRGVSFALQRTIIIEAMNTKGSNVGCGDATGLGMDSNETLNTKYGDRWQPHTFSTKGKREIGSLLATTFDDNDQIIPPTDGEHKFIATDLYAVQKESTGENLKLVESDNPLLPESHCDVAYSAGLAQKAGQIVFAQPYATLID